MSGAPFGQQYGQAGVQQMGAAGVNAQQLQNKTALSNNLPQFPAELKGAGSVPNMVSVTRKKVPPPLYSSAAIQYKSACSFFNKICTSFLRNGYASLVLLYASSVALHALSSADMSTQSAYEFRSWPYALMERIVKEALKNH